MSRREKRKEVFTMRGHTIHAMIAGAATLFTVFLVAVPASCGVPGDGYNMVPAGTRSLRTAEPAGTVLPPGDGVLYLCERMYEWTDADGQVHLTNEPGEIPASASGRVKSQDMPDYDETRPGGVPDPGAGADTAADAGEGSLPADAVSTGQGAQCRQRAQEEIGKLRAQLDHDREALNAIRQQIVHSPYTAVQDQYRQQLDPLMQRMEDTRKALDEATAREEQCP